MTDYVMIADSLRFQRGNRLILDIGSLKIQRGRVSAIIGPNGAGKSTLIRILNLLQKPDAGSVSMFEDSHTELEKRRRMALVMQNAYLVNGTVRDNVAMGLRFRGIGEVDRRVSIWLERLGIASLAHRQARSLSGGEAQRVNLARALAIEPEVLFLDEPFAALDRESKSILIKELRDILKETEQTAVFVSHDFTEVLYLADWVYALQDGRITQEGTPEDVLVYPERVDLAKFVGIENLLAGRVISVTDRVSWQSDTGMVFELPYREVRKGEYYLALRPENGRIGSQEGFSVSGKVIDMTPEGFNLGILVHVDNMVFKVLTQPNFAYQQLMGQVIDICWDERFIHLIEV